MTSTNRRKYNSSGRITKSHLTSGDSADGELSDDDEVCRGSGYNVLKFVCNVC